MANKHLCCSIRKALFVYLNGVQLSLVNLKIIYSISICACIVVIIFKKVIFSSGDTFVGFVTGMIHIKNNCVVSSKT